MDGVGSDARLTCPTSISVDVTGTAVVGESREDYLFAELRGPRTVEIASGRVGTLDVSFAFDDDEVEMTDGGEPEVRIDCFGNVLLACFEPPCLFRIANTGLNRVYLGADTPWQPTRKYHRTVRIPKRPNCSQRHCPTSHRPKCQRTRRREQARRADPA